MMKQRRGWKGEAWTEEKEGRKDEGERVNGWFPFLILFRFFYSSLLVSFFLFFPTNLLLFALFSNVNSTSPFLPLIHYFS